MAFGSVFTAENLPPWMVNIAKGMAERSEAIGTSPYNPYRGQRLAPMDQKESMEMLNATRNLPQSYADNFNRANQQLGKASEDFPSQYKKYMNPYITDVVNRIQQEGMRNFREGALPELEARFLKRGQHGSSRHRDLSLKAARDAQAEILGKQREALAHGYGQAANIFASDRARSAENARSYGNLGLTGHGLRLSDMAALESQYAKRQDERQRGLDIAYQDFMRQVEYPRERAAHQSSLIAGLPMPRTSEQYNQVAAAAPPPRVNTIGQLGNLAGNILGAAQAMAPRQQQQYQPPYANSPWENAIYSRGGDR
jgi:hypothetical protein